MSARPIAEKLREPGLVLDLLVQDRERKVVGAMILPGSHIADVRVAADRALFGGEQNLQHRFRVGRVFRQRGRRAGRDVVEIQHAAGELAADDLILTVDADGQHDPEEVEGMTAYLLENRLDAVIARRDLAKYTAYKKMGNFLMSAWPSMPIKFTRKIV